MNHPESPNPTPRRWRSYWPWALLLVLMTPAVWHDLSFPDETDGEFPKVNRPTFSAHPPPAYRLAEPGDTIDRVAIYVSAIAIVLSLSALLLSRDGRRRWVGALTLSAAALWYAATPGPTFDRWHGLGWRAMLDPSAPVGLRFTLGVSLVAIVGLVVGSVGLRREDWVNAWGEARRRRVAGLLVVAGVLTLWRLTSFPDVEPLGYWPRWAFVWGLVAFAAALIRLLPRVGIPRFTALSMGVGNLGLWYALVCGGVWLTWYHRPLERLREVVPGKVYISAMPTKRGLEVAQARHHFKTIINLFPEDTPQRSPRLGDELRFVQSNGIDYLRSPSDVVSSNDFLDQTLAKAQDPNAWPVLVHCHGCMDRTPAWVGIYRFVVEGAPLDDVFRFIEGHRGYRPKASVSLLYNRVLPRLAPGHYRDDPTAALLRRNAAGTVDPYYKEYKAEAERGGRANRPAEAVSHDREPAAGASGARLR